MGRRKGGSFKFVVFGFPFRLGTILRWMSYNSTLQYEVLDLIWNVSNAFLLHTQLIGMSFRVLKSVVQSLLG
jgi:hypothetical protein